jgi:GntR family transcriptional regulator
MLFNLNPSSGVPVYLQLIEQVKHAIESGVVRAGEQLPSVRQIAEELLINPNTVARAYRELEHEGILELKHGSGAYICESVVARAQLMQKARTILHSAVDRLDAFDLSEEEIRRLVESELTLRRTRKTERKKHA